MGFTTLAAGIGFTEGPVWTADETLLVTSMSRGLLYRVDLHGQPATVVAETGGGPNGLAEGPDGVVYVAQNDNVTIQSRSPRPVRAGIQAVRGEAVADLVGGCQAPNDCAFGPDGRLWFTDPPREKGGVGRVCALAPETSTVATALAGVEFPNGLAFADDQTLILADTACDALRRYRLRDGVLEADGLLAELPGSGPDGIAFDAAGNLWVAAFASEQVIAVHPDGEVVARINLPGARPTNLCFAGPGLEVLVVTCAAGGRVVALDGLFSGRALVHSAA